MQSQQCAALTMVWKSYAFLEKWIDYYGAEFGKENLFVLAHGEDEKIQEICKDVNLWVLPREFTVDFDPIRWQSLSEITSALTKFYKAVICCDCDELVVVDPDLQLRLKDYLLEKDDKVPLQATGFNLLPIKDKKAIKSVNWSEPLTAQMNVMSASLEYSKVCVAYDEIAFHPGGHSLLSGKANLTADLILFHLKYVDIDEWNKVADELKNDIKADIKRGGDKYKIGTHWRKGGRATASLGKSMMKGKTLEGDYIQESFAVISQAEYNSEWRKKFRNAPTKGVLDARFVGKF